MPEIFKNNPPPPLPISPPLSLLQLSSSKYSPVLFFPKGFFAFNPGTPSAFLLAYLRKWKAAALTSDVPDVTLMRTELSLVRGLTAIKLSER